MFETAELGRRISKQHYKKQESILRQELLEVQQELLALGRFPVILLFTGVDGAGKGQTVNKLNEWMDPRWLVTQAYDEPSDEERERPEFWRFWLGLPEKGRIGMFLSAWYSRPLLDRVHGRLTAAQFDRCLDRIVAFENTLAEEGAVILKFWMHLSRDAQKSRLNALEQDPLVRWQIKETSWEHWRMYDKFIEAAEQAVRRCNSGKAPIHIVEGEDPNYRSLTVGTVIRDVVRKRLQEVVLKDKLQAELEATMDKGSANEPHAVIAKMVDQDDEMKATATPAPVLTVLSTLDMTSQLTRDDYHQRLKQYQAKLNQLHHKARERGTSTLLVFEGWDASGKSGAIRRVTAALEARNYRVRPFAAPTHEKRAQHYLWLFWRRLSRAGRVTIYDRSWYGRVLVERVEGFATEAEWQRAYAEINEFETELTRHGIVLMKYWLHITKEEQLARFHKREQTPHKRWKLTNEDWRNREKWDLYALAVNDMVQYTSTRKAPWILVEANDKRYARIKVLKTLCRKLGHALGDE